MSEPCVGMNCSHWSEIHGCTEPPQKPEYLMTQEELYKEELEKLRGQCVRWEAMYAGMMAERDGLTIDLEEMTSSRNYWQDETMNLRSAGIWCADCPLVNKRP